MFKAILLMLGLSASLAALPQIPSNSADLTDNTEENEEDLFEDAADLADEQPLTLTSLNDTNTNKDSIPYTALSRFVDVFDNIKRSYIEEASNDELIENAIRGMISRLDPHSAYFNEDEYQAFKEQTDGEYSGIGVVLGFKDGAIEVISAIAGSPAEHAGIMSGDIVTMINNQSLQDTSLQDAINLFEQNRGVETKLTVVRDDKLLSFTLTNETIQTNSVVSQWLAPGIAEISISQFQEDTATSLQEAITSLQESHTIEGLILDLRNNPGGYLLSAVDSANLFLNNGDILSVRNRENMEQQHYSADEGDILDGAPIVVLVNRGSASSAEILTAALQDNHRAIVAGQKTYGKGSLQTLIPLYDGGAIKLTTAKYYTPKGNLIQARGIQPDIPLTPLKADLLIEEPSESEASLPNHLYNEQAYDKDNFTTDNVSSLATTDFILYEALNLLRTMILVK